MPSTKLILNATTLSKKIQEDLKREVQSYNPAATDMNALRASLAALTSGHMTEEIAKALSQGEPVEAGMVGDLVGDSMKLFFSGPSDFGFFMENITGGYGDEASRRKPSADHAFAEIARQLEEVSDKVGDRVWQEINKNAGALIQRYSFKSLSDWLKKRAGSNGDSGIEQKAYSTADWGLAVGGTGELNLSNKEDILKEAIKKLYSKMNTLYLMSTMPYGDLASKKVYVLAADLFHDLIFDKVISKFTSELIVVKIEGKNSVNVANAINTGTRFDVGKLAYKVHIDYRKLDDLLTGIGQDIQMGIRKAVEMQTQGGLMTKAGIYREHYNLFPGSEQRNFFHSVLDYMYARHNIYGITKED